MMTVVDVRFTAHGTLLLAEPLTERAREWLNDNTDGTWYAGALVVEPRYVNNLAAGLLTVSLPPPSSVHRD